MSELCDVGLYGLAVMGQNFALNIASHEFKVCVGNRSPAKVDVTVERAKDEGNLPLVGAYSIEEFVSKLSTPRKVIILVMAGQPVDDTIAQLSEYMEEGDVIVDGGNEWYLNSIKRSETLEAKGILFMGMGISGGEEGARNGPSLMPGGQREAYDLMEPILSKCAAQVDDGPCTSYIGPAGSGNYVKMVHNGIEYADMQLIAEAYDILRRIVQMSNKDMAAKFSSWNEGDLNSYLMEITSKIIAHPDDVTGEGYLIDYILDKTGMKGTGKWTVQEAAENSIPAPSISSALDVRYLSANKEERVRASTLLHGPRDISYCPREQLVEDLQYALYCSKLCTFAQGLCLIQAASTKNSWDINLSECIRIWKGGCIIRAKVLDKIQTALTNDPTLPNILLDKIFAEELKRKQFAWRRIVTLCVAYGVACPAFCASLNYYDSYRCERLPANLTQAQRDFFGGHSYERTDREGQFHCLWSESHNPIGDASERIASDMSNGK